MIKDITKNFTKVKWYDFFLWKRYLAVLGVLSSVVTLLSFFACAKDFKINVGILFWAFIFVLASIYFYMWYKANQLQEVHLKINQTKVNIKIGDIFDTKDRELNIIAFNNFYDTIADDRIISKASLHALPIELNHHYLDTR